MPAGCGSIPAEVVPGMALAALLRPSIKRLFAAQLLAIGAVCPLIIKRLIIA